MGVAAYLLWVSSFVKNAFLYDVCEGDIRLPLINFIVRVAPVTSNTFV